MFDILNQDTLYIWSAPFFITVILIEMYFSYKAKTKNYDFKDTATNVYFALANFGLDIVMKAFSFLVMGFCFQHRFVTWDNAVLYWIIAFVGQDFLYYIHHYVDHHSRFFGQCTSRITTRNFTIFLQVLGLLFYSHYFVIYSFYHLLLLV
ncbi:hypothetical protein [Tenacibaculum sp. SG-28]|uniref:hypothetical protein n=1 Tax=Tenacibaculum sp. SG-28 TaxID=754426 RepID=UPI001E28856C|nr:hypothetical protein [Tenacibaculum sp. SG-28]